jgi:hypothetical protein
MLAREDILNYALALPAGDREWPGKSYGHF